MLTPLWRSRFACLVVIAGSFAPFAAAQVETPPAVSQQPAHDPDPAPAASGAQTPAEKRAAEKERRQKIDSLRAVALGDDSAAAMGAVNQLHDLGEPARPALRDVLGKILSRDKSLIQNAHGLPTASSLHDVSEQLLAERQAARVNIDKLSHDDDTVPIAHKHYDSLKATWEKLHAVLALADAESLALSRRAVLIVLWREVMPNDKQFADDAEAKLAAKVQHDFGVSSTDLGAVPSLGDGDAPAEPILRDVYLYRACRRIAAYNATIAKCMSPGEQENFVLVNNYREYLGLMPFEIDPRLVNAARDHSQEMITLNYFAHESPVPANKTPWDRIRAAGYQNGSGENIAFGAHSGEKAFWMWFDSPGHHKNMAGKHTTMGVGAVATHWTQDMGSGSRLMLASPEDRQAELAKAKSATPAKAAG